LRKAANSRDAPHEVSAVRKEAWQLNCSTASLSPCLNSIINVWIKLQAMECFQTLPCFMSWRHTRLL